MNVIREISPNKNLALALGYFDGMHLAHKKIIQTLVATAKEQKIKSAVVTFSKNPADYFSDRSTPSIQSFKDREIILESLGVDYLYELDFEKYKDLSAFEYLKNVLIENFAPKIIIAGYNHTFGKDRSGNSQTLEEFATKFGYECKIIPEQKYKDKDEISSSIIRKKIELGDLTAAKALLGRNFSIRNSVIKGSKVARTLGLPTANLIWSNSLVKLPHGVYYGYTQVDSKVIPSLICWGNKPTLSKGEEEILETHIYDYKGDLYGKIITVIFVKFVRDVEKFGNVLVLKTQLQKDYAAFRKWAQLMT